MAGRTHHFTHEETETQEGLYACFARFETRSQAFKFPLPLSHSPCHTAANFPQEHFQHKSRLALAEREQVQRIVVSLGPGPKF